MSSLQVRRGMTKGAAPGGRELGLPPYAGTVLRLDRLQPPPAAPPPERDRPRQAEHEPEMERPFTDDDARTAALDERPTPRRNKRFRERAQRPIPEYDPPDWRKPPEDDATAALRRDPPDEDATAALPHEQDRTRALPSDGSWRDERQPPRQLVLDRYRLERRIGAGGFGVVWLAFDEKLEREVAVKVVPREGDDPGDS